VLFVPFCKILETPKVVEFDLVSIEEEVGIYMGGSGVVEICVLRNGNGPIPPHVYVEKELIIFYEL
jgi:hypothetical protein